MLSQACATEGASLHDVDGDQDDDWRTRRTILDYLLSQQECLDLILLGLMLTRRPAFSPAATAVKAYVRGDLPPPNAVFRRSSISAGVKSSRCLAIAQTNPNGSFTSP